ncbi:MAG: glutathione synthase [Legionella sp.]
MQIAIMMDPLQALYPQKDSTIAMIDSAQSMGWFCSYFTQHDLFCEGGVAYADMTAIKLSPDYLLAKGEWAKTTHLGMKPLNEFDIILMRKDPPFNLEYVVATYALELAERDGVLVANRPQSLRDANEKFFIQNFPQCCTNTLVSSNIEYLRAFWQQHKNVIFKPLDGMGGRSIFQVGEDGINLTVILETLTQHGCTTIMAQRYIPDITHVGDKRILIINGEPAPYALARIPAVGELRGNLAAGGLGKVVQLTERDYWICEQLSPVLREKGLYFVGIDVIGDFLTEINVTSPTCIREIQRETGLDIAGDYLRCLASLKLSM